MLGNNDVANAIKSYWTDIAEDLCERDKRFKNRFLVECYRCSAGYLRVESKAFVWILLGGFFSLSAPIRMVFKGDYEIASLVATILVLLIGVWFVRKGVKVRRELMNVVESVDSKESAAVMIFDVIKGGGAKASEEDCKDWLENTNARKVFSKDLVNGDETRS